MPIQTLFEGRTNYLQILDKEGKADPALDPGLPHELLLRAYIVMVVTRTFDDKCVKLQRQGRMYTYAPMLGQEAAQIGSAAALGAEDWMFPSYRENGSYLYRGVSMKDLMIYWMGAERGMASVKAHRSSTVIIPIATQILHAVGFAWAAKIRGDPLATLVYFGDGATSEGDFHAGMNFAAVFQTPTVFFCQNNQWAISVPRKKQTASATIAQKALAYGIEGIQVDGNDLLAVYKVTRDAITKAREGKGPTLIEAITYRMGPHTTSDDPTRYRNEEEVKYWEDRDPIRRLRVYLRAKGYLNDDLDQKISERAKSEVEKTAEEAETEATKADAEDVFRYTYARLPPFLQEQREELHQYLQRKG